MYIGILKGERITMQQHRLIVTISKAQYERLRKIAFENKKSIAQLIREAIEKCYGAIKS
jgi:predicted DNA-binding protein